MSEKLTYRPRPGSLPAEVIYFFSNNLDEELTLTDITDKFDCTRGNVHTNLGLAVDAGMLVRDRNVEGEYVYKAGPALASHKPIEPAAAEPKRKRVFVTPAVIPAIDAIAIEDNVPLPSGRANKVDWKPLLLKLRTGQSFKVPAQARHLLSNDMTALRKANQGVFTLRVFKETQEVRVWRTA